MQKFLIIQSAFIGDAVLATGIAEKIHQHFPDAQIDFMVRKGNEKLFDEHPFLNEVLIWDKKQDKFANLLKLLKRVRATRYDKVINVQRFGATGFLTVFSRARETRGFEKNPFSFLFTKRFAHLVNNDNLQLHEIARNHELIKDFTDDFPALPRLYPTNADIHAVEGYCNAEFITVAPASVWFTKQYPRHKWISFLQKLPQHVKIILLGAPSDSVLCQQIAAAITHHNVLDLSGKLSFLQSAALMKRARMNYVNDSAPMHFASAVNAPVSAVYCSTIPAFGFGPLSDDRHIVEIQEPLECRPCGLHGFRACPLGHFNCANKIEDRQLIEILGLHS